MNDRDVAEVVLYNFECFWVLQELDELCLQHDDRATSLLETLYAPRPVAWQQVHPFIRLKTTLNFLIVPVGFVCRLGPQDLEKLGFGIREEYGIEFYIDGQPSNPTPINVLQTLRNALAHLPDFAAGTCDPSIWFDQGLLRAVSSPPGREREFQLVFRNEDGWIMFVRDVFALAKKRASQLLDRT